MRALALAIVVGCAGALAAAPARADGPLRIDRVSPSTVAAGDRVTITGDFAALDGRRPRVVAERDGVRRDLRLRVVSHDAGTIVAEVRRVPDPRGNPSDGAAWTLRVAPPGRRAAASATADAPLVTSAPVIEDVRPDAIHAGWDLLLLVRCPGARRPRVLFGEAEIPSRRVRVEPDPDDPARSRVWARVPHRVGNGEHAITLKARLGRVVAAKTPTVAGCNDPPPPPPKLGDKVQMNVTVTGTGFRKELKKGFVFGEWVFGSTLLVQGCFDEGRDDTCARFCAMTVIYPEDGRTVGPVFIQLLSYNDSSDFQNGTGTGVNDLYWDTTTGIQGEIVESSSTRLKGTFRGTVFASGEEQPQRLEVDGTFVIRR